MHPVRRLRHIGRAEAASFLALLFIAMPLKHGAGLPIAVKIAGWIHGLLFILFCVALSQAMQARSWPPREAARYLIAALLPFGPFVVDRRLEREEADRP